MAEPYDVEKRAAKTLKAAPVVKYIIHDSDDEDHDTKETRKSLRTAEHLLKARFFTNDTDRKKYDEMSKTGKLREEVKRFEEKDDEDPVKTKEEVDQRKEESKENKARLSILR